jgi:hypothetical protein
LPASHGLSREGAVAAIAASLVRALVAQMLVRDTVATALALDHPACDFCGQEPDRLFARHPRLIREAGNGADTARCV